MANLKLLNVFCDKSEILCFSPVGYSEAQQYLRLGFVYLLIADYLETNKSEKELRVY